MSKVVLAFIMLLALSVAASPQTKSRWMNGTWEGTGYQTDSGDTWTIKLTARGRRFLIEYPSLDCGGEWTQVGATRWRATFREKISRGTERCVESGNVTILRLSGGQLLFMFSHVGSRQVTASAVLNRKATR